MGVTPPPMPLVRAQGPPPVEPTSKPTLPPGLRRSETDEERKAREAREAAEREVDDFLRKIRGEA